MKIEIRPVLSVRKKVAFEKVRTIISQKALEKIALDLEKDDEDLRMEAVKKITCQQALKRIVMRESYNNIIEVAMKKITQQKILKEIALKTPYWFVREKAGKKIRSQRFLKMVALQDESPKVRTSALKRVNSRYQEFFKNVAFWDCNLSVRSEALRKMKEKKKKCIYCKKLVKENLLYGDGVCKKCIKAGRPPFKG